jgi:hypothetical protein
MNVITLIAIVIIAWLIYSLIQSHHNIEKELREIRIKCVLPSTNYDSSTISTTSPASYSNKNNYPLNSLKSSLVSNLTTLLPNN